MCFYPFAFRSFSLQPNTATIGLKLGQYENHRIMTSFKHQSFLLHYLFYFASFPLLFHPTTVIERLYFIVDTYVKSRENREHQYWPYQSLPIREKNPYWWTSTICTTKTVFFLFM